MATQAPTPQGYQQALIEVTEGEMKGQTIYCWFNPKEYSISKQNAWEDKKKAGGSIPDIQFGGGGARELTLELLFDAHDTESDDVVAVCNQLFKIMEADKRLRSGKKNTARPPKVRFCWGSGVGFNAAPKSLRLQFTLFRPNGAPTRAQATITLVQVDPVLPMSSGSGSDKRQNPTTTGIAGLTAHVVRDGDSLQSIAFAHYGDATSWRAIAEANEIDDPLRLRRGTVLSIPGASD